MAPPTDPKDANSSAAPPPPPPQGNAATAEAQPPNRLSQPQQAPPPRPPRPPPPPTRPKGAGGLFADLPDLPNMAAKTSKRNLTLVGMLQATQAAQTGVRRFILPGVGVVALSAIVASVILRERLVKYFMPQTPVVQAPVVPPVAPVLTPQQKAAMALAAGSEAYASRDYGKAVASFEQALNLDPTLADAHRSLGIVHADLHDEAEAIVHYQKYIDMVPHGRDSVRVKKIIDDYNLAHAPPPLAPAPPPPPPVQKLRRHRGRLHHR